MQSLLNPTWHPLCRDCKVYRKLSGFQSIYYIITGVWPLVSMNTFMLVTGSKTDVWLVEMVGLLAASIGIGLGYAVVTHKFDKPLLVLLICAAGAFIFIDVYYSVGRIISFVYLPDAALQLIFAVAHAGRLFK